MSGTNNHPTISGDERLGELQKYGKFLDCGPYHTLSAGTLYAVDSAFDALKINQAAHPEKYLEKPSMTFPISDEGEVVASDAKDEEE